MTAHLVVVSGLPAAGKSSLAARLGRDLRIPVVRRDRLRRAISVPFDGVPTALVQIPEATGRVVIEMLGILVEAGVPAVLDGNFNTPEHSARLRTFIAARGVSVSEVCLWADTAVLRERFVDRADPPLTDDLRPYFETVLHRAREPAVAEPDHAVHIDTTDFRALEDGYPDLLADLRRRITS